MSAFETPWLLSMSRPAKYSSDDGLPPPNRDHNPPTIAAFSPASNSGYNASAKQRSTVIVHKKSPLLVATPPQITRALAHSHPFLLPLNRLLGLLSWSTEDPWQSFLMICGFWITCLYGKVILEYGGPIILVTFIIFGMYSRRYSPLSSSSKTGEKHVRQRNRSDTSANKSLDEIVATLQELTTRCNILLEPFLIMTDFLSTQRTPTSATTRPALTSLFLRILLVTPFWIALTLPPLHILSAQRILLLTGTIVLSWHSDPARITRVILWRSVFLRRLARLVTGLDFSVPGHESSTSHPLGRTKSQVNFAAKAAATGQKTKASSSPGVRFTFILYENQRRWIGLGWTTSLFAGERTNWTDEHLNPCPSKDEFELPDVDGGVSRWRWVDGSSWQIENGDAKQHKRSGSKTGPAGSTISPQSVQSRNVYGEPDGGGWIYYDNKWEDGRKEDGWGRYTRRRKWWRDAELVESSASEAASPVRTRSNSDLETLTPEERVRRAQAFAQGLTVEDHDPMADSTATLRPGPNTQSKAVYATGSSSDAASTTSKRNKSKWFGRGRSDTVDSKASSAKSASVTGSGHSNWSRDGPEDDHYDRYRDLVGDERGKLNFNEDLASGLG